MMNHARKTALTLAAALIALLAASCASTASFNYVILPGSIPKCRPLPGGKSIAVLPFTDQRPHYQGTDGQTEERGSFAAGWLPLLPYAWVEKSFPEQKRQHRFATLDSYWCQFDRELAQAATESLEFCGLFDKVTRVEEPGQSDADWLFRGYYLMTEYQGERLTYCLSYPGAAVLWVIGFPCAVSHCRLALVFEVEERATGRVLWRYAYNGSDSIVQWLYYNYGEDTRLFTKLADYALGAAIHDLQNAIVGKKNAFGLEKFR